MRVRGQIQWSIKKRARLWYAAVEFGDGTPQRWAGPHEARWMAVEAMHRGLRVTREALEARGYVVEIVAGHSGAFVTVSEREEEVSRVAVLH